MNSLLNLGKYLFALPMAFFGVGHLTSASAMAGMAPFGGEFIVYITGVCLIAAAVSIIIGKYDKLACVLLGIFLLLTAFTVHLPGMMGATDEMAKMASNSSFMKDLALAGGAWGFALLAKDKAVIG